MLKKGATANVPTPRTGTAKNIKLQNLPTSILPAAHWPCLDTTECSVLFQKFKIVPGQSEGDRRQVRRQTRMEVNARN